MSFNWHKAAETAQQETAAHLENTHRTKQLGDNQLMGGYTSKKTGFDYKPTTQQTIETMAKMKKAFDFGAKPLRNRPALTALTHKELYVFGAESSPSQSTPTAPKQEARRRESLPPCIPAVLLRTALRGRRPTDANCKNSKRRRRHHDRRVTLGGTRVRAKHSR